MTSMLDGWARDVPRRAWTLFLGPALVAVLLLQGCATAPSPAPPSAQGPVPTQEETARVPDATPRVEPLRTGGPNKPYVVLGQSYAPQTTDLPWREEGLASWYGPSFQGHRTASGEIYNMYGMSAAHRTLPIPSYVRVRNLDNGRETIVRVNDRGPFHSHRILDLSYAAATKLGIVARGTARVEVRRLTFDDIRTGAWRDGGTSDGGGAALASLVPPAGLPSPATSAADDGAPTGDPERGGQDLDDWLAKKMARAPPQDASPAPAVAAVVAPPPADSTAANIPVADTPTVSSETASAHPELSQVVSTQAPDARPVGAAQTLAADRGARNDATLSDATLSDVLARAYTPVARGFWVQLGVFSRSEGARACHEHAVSALYWLAPLLTVFHEASMFRVQAGPYTSREQASQVASRVRQALSLTPMIVERR